MLRLRVASLALLSGGMLATPISSAGARPGLPDTIFGGRTPRVAASHSHRPIEVGVRFRVKVAGRVTGVRFYKGAANSGRHIGTLWTARGRLLARADFRHESRSGWQSVTFPRTVRVRPGVTYVAGYHAPHGHFALTRNGLASGLQRGPLVAVSTASRRGGVYRYGGPALPTHTHRADNFWVDVTFVPIASATSGGIHGGGSGDTGSGGNGSGGSGSQQGPITPTTDCFSSPGACGFPDPSYDWHSAGAWQSGGGGVGPTDGTNSVPCSSLPSSGSITTSSDGQMISDLNISGTLQIRNSNITIENVCVTNNGGGALGSNAIKVLAGGLTIQDSTLAGANDSNRSVEQAITNFGGGTVTMSHDYVYDCGECLNTGSWQVSDSYILNNGMYGTNDHLEAIYVEGSGDTVTVEHSTVLSPPGWDGLGSPQGGQASLFFGDTNSGRGGGCSTVWTVSDNLLAGDGVLIYECGNAASVGSAALSFADNRIAACSGSTFTDSQGFRECADVPAQNGGDTDRSGDGSGYFPNGGLKGTDVDTYCTAPSTDWTNNLNEATGATIGC